MILQTLCYTYPMNAKGTPKINKDALQLRSIIQFNNEIKYLKERIKYEGNSWGLLGRWADIAGCHRPQFSNILAEKASLTMDQAFNLASALNFSEIEKEYFLLLVELRRTALSDYKKHLNQKMSKIREDQERLELRLQRSETILASAPATYYSSWFWSAIHIACSIPSVQTSTALSKHLGIPKDFTLQILKQLEIWGLIKATGADHWCWASGEIHLPKESPLSVLHQNNWRQKAVENAQFSRPQSVHFTGLYSMNLASYEELKELLLHYIEQYNKKAMAAEETILVCFNTDLFQIVSSVV